MRVTHAGLHLCRTGTFKMQDVFDMVYSVLVFVNIRVILYKTYVVLICGKYNTLTLEFKINIAICVPLQMKDLSTWLVVDILIIETQSETQNSETQTQNLK